VTILESILDEFGPVWAWNMVSDGRVVIRESWTPLARLRDSQRDPDDNKHTAPNDVLRLESARSILTIAPHPDAVLAVAQNLVAVPDFGSLERLGSEDAALALASALAMVLDSFRRTQLASDLENASILFKATLHTLLATPEQYRYRILFILPQITDRQKRHRVADWLSDPELKLLYLTVYHLSVPGFGVLSNAELREWRGLLAGFPLRDLIDRALGQRGGIHPSTALAFLHSIVARSSFTIFESDRDMLSVSDAINASEWLLYDERLPSTACFMGLTSQLLSDVLGHLLSRTLEASEYEGAAPLGERARMKDTWTLRMG
jgi:hypothetical protein